MQLQKCRVIGKFIVTKIIIKIMINSNASLYTGDHAPRVFFKSMLKKNIGGASFVLFDFLAISHGRVVIPFPK